MRADWRLVIGAWSVVSRDVMVATCFFTTRFPRLFGAFSLAFSLVADCITDIGVATGSYNGVGLEWKGGMGWGEMGWDGLG